MKISKDGKVILTKNDRRVGNFVYSNYPDRVAFSDINGTVRTSVAKRTLVGQMIADAIASGLDNFLHNYAGYLYYINGVAPDHELIKDVFAAAEACLKRHPDLYGAAAITDGDDARVIREERELMEFERDARRMAGDQ